LAAFLAVAMATPPDADDEDDELQLDERRERMRGACAEDHDAQRASSASRTSACIDDVHDVLDDADELEPCRLPPLLWERARELVAAASILARRPSSSRPASGAS